MVSTVKADQKQQPKNWLTGLKSPPS